MWLWITLGIVGVLIIGGLGYYFYNKNNKTEEKETNNPLIWYIHIYISYITYIINELKGINKSI